MLTNLSLFSGAGGLDLAAKWTGKIKTVAYVEIDRYAQAVLMSRMRSGDLDNAPIFEDVRTFRGAGLRGSIDIVSGGFPCQDVSSAGKRAGIKDGTRSGLWSDFHRIICEVKPRWVVVENVRGLLSVDIGGGFGTVLRDLADSGFNAAWFVLSAADVGAPHRRERVWIVADSRCDGGQLRRGFGELDRQAVHGEIGKEKRERVWDATGSSGEALANPAGVGLEGTKQQRIGKPVVARTCDEGWWVSEPNVGRVANGVAFAMDRLRLCGNGVVPQQALPAFQKIIELAERA